VKPGCDTIALGFASCRYSDHLADWTEGTFTIVDDHLITQRFAKTDTVVSRRIGNECLIVPIHRRAQDVESIYSLNEVGARVWELLDEAESIEQVSDLVVREFEVMQEEALADVLEIVLQLEAIGALRRI
jgi:hypothetical protein